MPLIQILIFLMFFLWIPFFSLALEPLIIDRFDDDLSAWEVQLFEGETDYRVVVEEGGGSVLQATSYGAASGLVKKIDVDPAEYPIVTWRWKVEGVLERGDARTKEGDDYAARVYVIFPHWIKPLTRSINYIWANRLPRGEAVPNAYYSRAMLLALQSGDEHAGQWITEERNIVEDYRNLFDADPPRIGAIAIMTDTDNTGESVRAWYDDLILLPAATPE
ncbi:MAG: DUF3047 domain-containing protein [Pelovirga sp.]